MKKITMAASFLLAAFVAGAVNVTVKNFDDDLATVYVNGTATTNGQVVAVDGDVTLELKDFRSDYYYRFAPASQTDRALAFESWEGVPAGYEAENPATFTPEGDYTVTPNVDVKGYAWQVVTVDNVTQLSNDVYRWGIYSRDDALRTYRVKSALAVLADGSNKDLVVDMVERVRYGGRNYTVASFYDGGMKDSCAGTLSVSPKCGFYCVNFDNGGCLTNVVGFEDLATATIGVIAFGRTSKFDGPVNHYVPKRGVSFGGMAYSGKAFTGELLLESVQTINDQAFLNCAGLTSLRVTSPDLATLGASAFSGCGNLRDVYFDGSLAKLSSVGTSAFKNTVTNFAFTVEPPARAMLDNLLDQQTAADGAHGCRLTVDPASANWWALTAVPSAAEVNAGLPPNCMGSYETEAGGRKAWIVGSTPLSGVLLVGDMTMSGNAGFTPVTGLEAGSSVQMTAPVGFDQCELQKVVDGQWSTYETVKSTSFTYTHSTELVRAVWGVAGAKLTVGDCVYGGSVSVTLVSGEELLPGVYSKGSVVRLAAFGRTATHPTSHFTNWTAGVAAAYAGDVTVDLALADDVEVQAEFRPDEWVYTNETMITDGEWKISKSTIADGDITVKEASGGRSGTLWLDLSLPVLLASDLSTTYRFTALCCTPESVRKIRLAKYFTTLGNQIFQNSTTLDDIQGLGASSLTYFTYYIFNSCQNAPIHQRVYEANDFIPPALTSISFGGQMYGAPYLTGTLELKGALNFTVTQHFEYMNTMYYKETKESGEIVGVTNLLLTSELPTDISNDQFNYARANSITFGMTNLLTVGNNAFYSYKDAKSKFHSPLERLVFLAHAPTTNALDGVLYYSETTNVTIYCSRHAPGWKELRLPQHWKAAEWAGRPAGCWGLYQTTTGVSTLPSKYRRFYLVQRDSKYDRRDGLMVIVK